MPVANVTGLYCFSDSNMDCNQQNYRSFNKNLFNTDHCCLQYFCHFHFVSIKFVSFAARVIAAASFPCITTVAFKLMSSD